MNRIPYEEDDGPELVPPAELLRLRNLLMRGPRAATRARHLAVATLEARQRPLVAGAAGRFATWGGRVAVGIVASLAITSGLAGAQLLPQPAQRLLSGVSARFAPQTGSPSTTVAEPADPVAASGGGSSSSDDRRGRAIAKGTGDSSGAPDDLAPASPPTTDEPLVVTTIPGPTGPGSPTDPSTDPDDPEPSTTTTTEPEPTTTTTTTTPPSTTTTTTTPPSSTTTTPSSSR